MSNPFEVFRQDDSEDDEQVVIKPGKTEEKPKRTHQERKNFKKNEAAQPVKYTLLDEPQAFPEHLKEKKLYARKDHLNKPQKDIGEGHTLDRRSGTGRVDRPRKEGGGRGNLGNLKDEQNPDKYIKEERKDEEETTPVVVVPVVPQAPTLDEYYRSKGIAMSYNVEKKEVKKGEIKADWIQKEKLVVLQTKSDKKNAEKAKQAKPIAAKVVEEEQNNLAQLGFGKGPAVQEEKVKGRKNTRIQFSDKDFPAL